jgi:hypothetical protein
VKVDVCSPLAFYALTAENLLASAAQGGALQL